jgi:hypothetical protein
MVAFYNAKDQAIYDAGDKFVPQTEYLQNDYVPTEGISYEGDGSPVSYAKSGIMTQAPIIYPPINQGGGGEGGGDDDDDDDNNNPKGPKGPSVSPFEAAKQAGLFFLNPIGYLASKAFGAYRKHGQRKKADNITNQASGLTDRGNITNVQDYTGKKLSDYRMSRPASERNFTGHGKSGMGRDPDDKMAKGGRVGYFFGGRVNYKAGGRTDAGANRSTASKAGVGQINESGQKVSGGNYNNNNDGGDGIKPTFYDNNIQVITDKSKLGFDYPTGLTKNLGIGQLTAILDAKKSLEEEKPEGFVQYDSSIGPFNTTATYDTITGPEFNANYTNNNLNANLNSKTGLGVDYSKDIGPGTFTAGGTYSPDGTYNAEAKYGISFANGGLASIL